MTFSFLNPDCNKQDAKKNRKAYKKSFFDELKTIDVKQYGPIPFWSWNNILDKDELLKQIKQMHEVGFGGFIIHARAGLRVKYLSDEWFELVGTCLKEAKKRNMSVWIYDENGYPSGFCGGKLLKDTSNLASYLSFKVNDYYDKNAFAVYCKIEGKFQRINETFFSEDKKYYTINKHNSIAYVDILNSKVVNDFIENTHENYYKKFNEYFGNVLAGFFTDEPQYFRYATPYSSVAELEFRKKFNENLIDGLINLFLDEECSYPFKVKYYSLLNELYVNNYYKKLYDWCECHNCKLTGHSVEESSLITQMWGGANCSTSYEYEHIPAIDNLGKIERAGLSARQVGSVAGQLGKKFVLTESFGCSGYDATPRTFKAIIDKQYVHGVNLLCNHLYPYSLAGQGKADCPPCFSNHITWNNDLKIFNKYVTRLGYLLSNSKEIVDCAVVNPMSSIYLKYDRHNESKALDTDKNFLELQTELNKNNILYDILDEVILKKYGKVKNGFLNVGLRNYKYIIVPKCEGLLKSTFEILSEFQDNYGKILMAGTPKYVSGIPFSWDALKTNTSFDEIKANGAVVLESKGEIEYTYREKDGYKLIFAVNISQGKSTLCVPNGFNQLDLVTLQVKKCDNTITLDKDESVLLINKNAKKKEIFARETDITKNFKCVDISLNCLTLNRVEVSTDGKEYRHEEDLQLVFRNLLKEEFNSKIFVRFNFNVVDIPSKIILRREKAKYINSYINGKEIEFVTSKFDVMFEERDISVLIKKGLNNYTFAIDFYERKEVYSLLNTKESAESLINCLYYDTMLENVYLLGNFNVDRNRNIVKQALPNIENNLELKGYPNFVGRIDYVTSLFCISNKVLLKIYGDYTDVEVFVNNKKVGSCLFENEIVIPVKQNVYNDIKIRVCSSLRNMFGPFHFYYLNDFENSLCPLNFNYIGFSEEDLKRYYLTNYSYKKFGIDKILLMSKQGESNENIGIDKEETK